ncbi:uncharacterized protein LOC141532282 [Cotesia typhae]|uniref:uncharacterized protein LOC141532282 n=1 Tax=Cotesia typhae TaxID=2053667 RepID=UPI003D68F341
MTTYGIIIQLVTGSLLLAGSTGQTNDEDDSRGFEEYSLKIRYSLDQLYYFADKVFGADNWSHDIYQTCDSEKVGEGQDMRFAVCRSTVKISLPNGVRRSGVGMDSGVFSINDGLANFEKKSLEEGFYNALMAFNNASTYILTLEYDKFKDRKMQNDEDKKLNEGNLDDGELPKVDESELDKVPLQ